MYDNNPSMSQSVLVYCLGIYQALTQESPEVRGLVKPNNIVIALHLSQRSQR